MVYIKTAYLLLYIAFGLCVAFLALTAAVGSHPILCLALTIYALSWWIVGGAAFMRPNNNMRCFIALDLIAFVYFLYMLIHESYIIVRYGVMQGHVIEPGTQLYYRMEETIPLLCYSIILALEGIVSYIFLKRSKLGKN
jgi:hypothetical protein